MNRRILLGAGLIGLMASGAAEAQNHHYTIGISNGWVGSEWRTQMVDEAVAAAKAWKERGVDVDVSVQSKTQDVQAQIADVRNFVSQGVNAIIVNPNSPTAFSPIFAQAKKAGIVVVATDGEVASKDAIFVGIDQKAWAAASAKWLAETLGGKGSIVVVNGIAGHPANQARVAGSTEVFAQNPGIKVVNTTNADWDEAKGQQVVKTLLATYPKLDGVWVQDGMADGAWRAIVDSGRASLPATGELRHDFVKKWAAGKWNSAVAINPPGCMANALNVAVLLLEGGKLKPGALQGPNGNALYLPTVLVTSATLADYAKQLDGKPDYQFISLLLPVDDLKARFFQ